MSNIRSFTAPEPSQGCTSDREPLPGRISSCHSNHGPLPTQTKGLTKAMWLGHFRLLLDLQPHLTALWAPGTQACSFFSLQGSLLSRTLPAMWFLSLVSSCYSFMFLCECHFFRGAFLECRLGQVPGPPAAPSYSEHLAPLVTTRSQSLFSSRKTMHRKETHTRVWEEQKRFQHFPCYLSRVAHVTRLGGEIRLQIRGDGCPWGRRVSRFAG